MNEGFGTVGEEILRGKENQNGRRKKQGESSGGKCRKDARGSMLSKRGGKLRKNSTQIKRRKTLRLGRGKAHSQTLQETKRQKKTTDTERSNRNKWTSRGGGGGHTGGRRKPETVKCS